MCLFAALFDEKCEPLDSQLTRNFPARAAANPAAFFLDGYSPETDLKQFLLECQPWHYAVLGSVTTVTQPGTEQEDGSPEVRDEVRVSGIKSKVPITINSTVQDELCKKATKPVYHLLDMSEKVKEILPDAKGLVQVLPPKNIKDAVRPPQGWTKQKEREFRRISCASGSGMVTRP